MAQLHADRFHEDPRVRQAQTLLLEALGDHQGALTGVRDPDPALAAAYAAQVERLGGLRGGPLYFPYLGSGLGRGCLVELADGRVVRDFIGGIGVQFFGHSHPALVAAAVDGALADVALQGNLQQNREGAELAARLLAAANRNGAGLDHAFLTTSGAMANENALKMVFQKHHPASRLLAFEGCFAGRTLALAQVTDRPAYREGLPRGPAVDYLPFVDPEDVDGSTARTLAALAGHLRRYPGRHAAMVLELVQGEGGLRPGDPRFFEALVAELRRHGIAVLVDEVQTFGRTPELFAFQFYGLDRQVDLVTVGKLSQVCATLFRDAYRPRPGLVSQTFTAASATLQVGLRVLDLLEQGEFFGPGGRNARLHERFAGYLERISRAHPGWLCGPYGIGAMVAFTPFDGSPGAAREVVQALFRAGLMGFVAGHDPSRVRFLVPAGAATDEDVDAACATVEQVLTALAAGREGAWP